MSAFYGFRWISEGCRWGFERCGERASTRVGNVLLGVDRVLTGGVGRLGLADGVEDGSYFYQPNYFRFNDTFSD